MCTAPAIPQLGGGELALGSLQGDRDWQMVVVYRDKHCPLCTNYRKKQNTLLPKFHALGADMFNQHTDE